MQITEIIKLAVDKKITYSEALEELKKLRLPEDTEEEYEIILHKILGDDKKLDHRPPFVMEAIPNSLYFQILTSTIKMIRDGMYTPNIVNELCYCYQLGPQLLNYFINEALSIVRLNNLSPEEITSIGEAYHMIANKLKAQGIYQKPEVKSNVVINAEEPDEIDVMLDEEDI